MKRPATLIIFGLAVFAGAMLFGVAFEVSNLEDRLTGLNKEITRDRDAIHVLRAEWSYLNQPERLDGLSQRHLELRPLEGRQFSDIAALPMRPNRVPTPTTDPVSAETAPAIAALVNAEPGGLPSAETPIATALTAKPKLKPAAPRRPARNVRLASQRISPEATTSTAASDKAALDAALRAIFGNTASNREGASR
ncbi:MAG: hypothetical protein GKS02_08800 [Alphaproteobacteria bacterium]|nr:hypothetical protein [Alphaproteobacteria bacterium]